MRTDKPEQKKFMPSPDCMDITDEKFQELTDKTVKLVEECDLGQKSMCAALMIHFREFDEQFLPGDIQHAVIIISGGMDNSKDKYETIKEIGRQCFHKKWFPVAVFMAAESWMSSIDAKDYKKGDPVPDHVQPSKDPNRKECIMIAGRTPGSDNCQVGVMIPLGRDHDGNMIRDGENIVTKELEMNLLNHFFCGFFEKVANMAKEGGGGDESRSM